MTDAEWTTIGQACLAVPSIIGAIGGVLAWMQGKRNAAAMKKNDEASRAAIQEVHASVNGQLAKAQETQEKLLATSIAAAHAQGVADERADKP